jgi:hypothetical protein
VGNEYIIPSTRRKINCPCLASFAHSEPGRSFLDCLAAGDSISKAATAAGHDQHLQTLAREDENFASDWDEAIEEGTDFIEDTATDRA